VFAFPNGNTAVQSSSLIDQQRRIDAAVRLIKIDLLGDENYAEFADD
jgi:hypothetical protein